MSVELKNLKSYLNFPNTTSTFRKIINKYHMKKNNLDKHNKKLLLKKIEAKIQELEKDEKENDFIVSEVRRNAQINKEMLYSFGTKVLNHLDEMKTLNVTSKIDRAKFFEIDNEDNLYQSIDNNRKNKSLKTKYNNKIIKFPKINVKRIKINNNENKKIFDNISINTKFEDSLDFKNKSQIKNKRINFSIDSKDKNKDIINCLTSRNKKEIPQNISLFSEKSNFTTEKDENDSKINSFRKRNIIIDNDYINYIQDIKNKFIITEKKHERYFDRYKYGYDDFKLKYKYLQNKYFK